MRRHCYNPGMVALGVCRFPCYVPPRGGPLRWLRLSTPGVCSSKFANSWVMECDGKMECWWVRGCYGWIRPNPCSCDRGPRCGSGPWAERGAACFAKCEGAPWQAMDKAVYWMLGVAVKGLFAPRCNAADRGACRG